MRVQIDAMAGRSSVSDPRAAVKAAPSEEAAEAAVRDSTTAQMSLPTTEHT